MARNVRSATARATVGALAAVLLGGAFWLDREPAAPAGPVITVLDAYVREPAVDDVAAAYFSVRNTGGRTDTLLSISSPAALEVGLHDLPGMPGMAGMAGHDEMSVASSMDVPPGQTVTLSPGQGHVMLEQPAAALVPGDQVTLVLTFADAGELTVLAPVIAIGAEPPGGRP